ncbi:Retrovirus-related Pol polyprotein from transposon RE2 [Cardamine amara subsp. amara]|uniref:Retrovirus-related Pol polyprotein from transposon RE2 n=1 Tax=Cardamine amara subsp. amara TaxID=228776 RepID=A0ABD0ZJ41_CARAN
MSTQAATIDSSSASLGSAVIVNPNDPRHPILSINTSTVTRLTASNYITWSLQVSMFLDGHNLLQHITDDAEIPAPTVQVNNLTTPNPAFTAWHKQDKLIFSAPLGSISTTI